MDDNDKKEFAALLAGTGELYDKALTSTVIGMYWQVLKGYSIEQVKHGFNVHVRTSQFMPKPADILKAIGEGCDDVAQRAWSKVYYAIRHHGHYKTVAFDDPRIHASVARMGGWSVISRVTDSELPFKQREFVRVYSAVRDEDVQVVPTKLLGLYDTYNVNRAGYQQQVVHKICDEDVMKTRPQKRIEHDA